jgi:hypothetical protein
MRAMGVSPCRSANSREATTMAAAPSLMLDALAAVTVPSFSNAGRNFVNLLGSPRPGSSSRLTRMGSPLRCGTGTGTISASNLPDSMAALARR